MMTEESALVLLRAYVDGELSPAERSKVEVAVAHSDALQTQLQAMKASCLPYRTAFDMQHLPSIPDHLQKQLDAMSAVAQSAPAPSTNNVIRPRRWFLRSMGLGAGIAASFAAGFVVRPMWFSPASAEWVKAVASYQALYVRETVGKTQDSPERTRQIIDAFQRQTNTQLVIPDLTDAGLEFRRIQRLGFGDQPLMQMAYLPTNGKPGALCVLPITSKVATPVSAQTLEGLSVVTWNRDSLAYVLVLDLPLQQASNVGEKLAAGKYSALFVV
jgi:anti-sigma factor RsiW